MAVDRKQQILDAAYGSFAQFGYKATTMDQVAKMADVGKGTIYTFFKNKEELFQEIIEQVIGEMQRVVDEVIDRERPFFDNLHRLLYRLLDFRAQHELLIRLLHEMVSVGTVASKRALDRLERAIIDILAKEIERGIVRGNVKDCDPEVTAFVMLKLYIALVSDWKKSREPFSKEEIARLFQLYVVEGVAK